jgi:hypothetical protein
VSERLSQPTNAEGSTEATLFGMVTSASLEHQAKA